MRRAEIGRGGGLSGTTTLSGTAANDSSPRRVTGGKKQNVVLVETAARASIALMTAPNLAAATKQKLLFHAAKISESEILTGLQVIREILPKLERPGALRVFAAARLEIAHNPAKYRVVPMPRSILEPVAPPEPGKALSSPPPEPA